MYEESFIIETIDGWFDANYNNYNVDKMNESYNTGIQRRAARIKAARNKAKMLRYRRVRSVGRRLRMTPSSDDDTDGSE